MPILPEQTVTPTLNSIPIRHGDFLTATDALTYAAQGEAGFNFFNVFGQLTDVLSYKQLQAEAMKVAFYLKQLGFSRNDRFILIAETSPEFLIFFFACQYSGLIPCPVAFSVNLGGMAAYTEKLNKLLRSSQASAVVCKKDIADYISKITHTSEKPLLTFEQFTEQAKQLSSQPSLDELSPFSADEAAYIQFSSGSTQNPKGVQITQYALQANVSVVLHDGMKLREEDRSFNWLPFHHNMGLIGFMFGSVYGQRSVDCLSAENFVQNPLIWLELMSAYKTAITFSPVFGYQLAMKAFIEKEDKPQLELSSLRIAGIGGDMIGAEMLNRFSSCFASSGFNHQAFLPSYGLTETTLAVSTADTEKAPFSDTLTESITQQSIVSCGKPLPGFEVKIIDSVSGKLLPEHHIGQIWVKGPSVITTYIDASDKIVADAENYIYTGDLGYFYQGELFISGREKDVIIIRGRNLWAQDIEWIVLQAQPDIGINNVAAISIPFQQQEVLALLISLTADSVLTQQTLSERSKTIQKAINQAIGVQTQIHFIADKLPLTASGKLARVKAKDDYLKRMLNIIKYPEENQ